MRSRACTACCLGTWIKPECSLTSGQERPPLSLCRQGMPPATLSFQVPLCIGLKNGLYTSPCALVRFPGQTAEGYIQQWTGLWIKVPAWAQGRSISIASKALCCLNSSQPTPQVLSTNRATGFVHFITSAHLPLNHKFHWATQHPWVVSSPSGQRGPEDTLCSGWGCDSAPCLGISKPGSMASKPLRLRILIRHICTLPSSLVWVHLWLGSADKQSHWLGLLRGLCWDDIHLRRSPCWWLEALPPSPSQIPSCWASQIPCNFYGARSE